MVNDDRFRSITRHLIGMARDIGLEDYQVGDTVWYAFNSALLLDVSFEPTLPFETSHFYGSLIRDDFGLRADPSLVDHFAAILTEELDAVGILPDDRV